jgi:hypothetical protein
MQDALFSEESAGLFVSKAGFWSLARGYRRLHEGGVKSKLGGWGDLDSLSKTLLGRIPP